MKSTFTRLLWQVRSKRTANHPRLLNVLVQTTARRALLTTVGVIAALIGFSGSAYAGYSEVLSCSTCVSSTDFMTAAKREASDAMVNGLFHVVSTRQASSAEIMVTGHFITQGGGETKWVVQSTVPVDTSGNSLASNSEADLETYFNSLDQMTFGSNRNSAVSNVNVPAEYQGTFVCSCDLEDMGAQVAGWISAQYHMIELLQVGTIVTLVFKDGSKAQFKKISASSTLRWQWNGRAWNSKGERINAQGEKIANTNIGGGAGSVDAPGFGDMQTVHWNLTDPGNCSFITTISIGGGDTGYLNVSKC